MKLLMIHACEHSVDAWKEGEYLDYRNIIVWSKVSKNEAHSHSSGSHTHASLSLSLSLIQNDGKGFVYKLSPR